jgi:hypothetical protein
LYDGTRNPRTCSAQYDLFVRDELPDDDAVRAFTAFQATIPAQ